MTDFGIGQPVRRKEDQRLVTDRGEFGDHLKLPNHAYAFDIVLHSSRSLRLGGLLLGRACDEIVARGKKLTAGSVADPPLTDLHGVLFLSRIAKSRSPFA